MSKNHLILCSQPRKFQSLSSNKSTHFTGNVVKRVCKVLPLRNFTLRIAHCSWKEKQNKQKNPQNSRTQISKTSETLKLLRPKVLPLRPSPEIHSLPTWNITHSSRLHLLIVDMVKYCRKFREYMQWYYQEICAAFFHILNNPWVI